MLMTIASEIRKDETPPEGASPRTRPHRARVAAALAVIGLLASVVGALGPSRSLHATYTWPTNAPTQAKKPRSFWYTPLLLERWTPQALSAHLPCSKAPALSRSARTVQILSTARHPRNAGGLSVVRSGDRMTVAIGTSTLAHAPLDTQAPNGTCSYTLRLAGDRFSIEGGSLGTPIVGTIASMPVVNGLFSGLDLGARPGLSVDVETQTFDTTPVLRQTIAWVVAALAILVALALVSFEQRPRPWASTRRLVRKGMRSVRPVDGVVFTMLAGWWVFSPAFYDDGWVETRQRMYSTSGGFSNYFNGLGLNLPNDFWLEWVEHWLAQATTALIVLRVPALVFLLAAWALCRWLVDRALASSAGDRNVGVWTLAGAFLVGAFAWGMTLRPEPATALLSVAVLACAFRFTEQRTTLPLALAGLLVPLAITAHHAGLVSLAPLVVISSALLGWARGNRIGALTIVLASGAALLLLGFVSSDLQQRRLEAHEATIAAAGGTSWLDEIQRYASLSNSPYGTPVRAASVALMWLAVIAFLLRRRREKQPLLDLPASALGIGFLLLIPLPDKWPWHFGALLAVGAVAIAAEAARLRGDASLARNWQARPFLVIGICIVATAWIWAALPAWSILDLRTLDWTRAFHRLQIGALVVTAPLLAMLAATLVGLARKDARPWRVPWRIAPWMGVIVAVPTVAFTIGVLATDTVQTPTWTLGRQNLDALTGDARCGVANDYDVAIPESSRSLLALTAGVPGNVPTWVPPLPVSGVPRFVLGPSRSGSRDSPWFRVPAHRSVGFFLTGSLGSSDVFQVAWGRSRGSHVATLSEAELDIPGAPAAPSATRIATLGMGPWRLFAAPELPARPRGANVVRFELKSSATPGPALAVTAPVSYASANLASLVGHDATPALVMPHLVTYLPCASQPRLQGGIAEVPAYIVSNPALTGIYTTAVKYPTSPFLGLLDLYSVSYLPVSNLSNPIRDFVVLRVNRSIPGAVELPPSMTTSS
jgi:arabinosyltransferase C